MRDSREPHRESEYVGQSRIRKLLRRFRRPGYRWVRIPLGVLLVCLGIVGFLPIVGFWMIPLGLWLLAVDFPAVRRLNKWLAARFGWNRQSRSDPNVAADGKKSGQARQPPSSPESHNASDSLSMDRTKCRCKKGAPISSRDR